MQLLGWSCASWEHHWMWIRFKSTGVSTEMWCHLVVLVRFNLNTNRGDLVLWLIRTYRKMSVIPWGFQLISYISMSKQEDLRKRTLDTPLLPSVPEAGLPAAPCLNWPTPPTTPLPPSQKLKTWVSLVWELVLGWEEVIIHLVLHIRIYMYIILVKLITLGFHFLFPNPNFKTSC